MERARKYDVTIASADDLDDLARLGRQTFVETFGYLYKPEDLSAFLSNNHTAEHYHQLLNDEDFCVWLARDEVEPVGYAVAGLCKLPVENLEPRAGEIKRLYLLPDHQAGGLGRRMMDDMMAWLVAEKFTPLYLSVYAENHGAQRFYARYGFEKIKEYEFVVGNHRDPEFIFRRPD